MCFGIFPGGFLKYVGRLYRPQIIICRLIGGKNSDFLFFGLFRETPLLFLKATAKESPRLRFYLSGKFTKRRFLCQRKLTSPSTVMRFDFEKKSAAPQRKSSFFDLGNLVETVFDSSDMG